MTSNIGTRDISEFGSNIGFTTKQNDERNNEYKRGVVEKALKKAFAPEFLNRLDDIIQFNQLSKDDIFKIIDIELNSLYSRVKDLDYELVLSDTAKGYIVEKGYDPKFGARPLKRAIQKYLEDPMAEYLLTEEAQKNKLISINLDEEKNELVINSKSINLLK